MKHIFFIFSLSIMIQHKVFHFLCNITQIRKLELPKNFSQNYHIFRHGSSRKICDYDQLLCKNSVLLEQILLPIALKIVLLETVLLGNPLYIWAKLDD